MRGALGGRSGERWRRRAGRVVAVGSWSCVAAALAGWAALYWGDLWWPATVWQFLPRWPLALPPALLAPAAVVLRRRSLGPLLLATILPLGPVMGLNIPWGTLRPAGPGGARLCVVTCNLHYTRPELSALVQLVAAARPDVLALQNMSGTALAEQAVGPGWHAHRGPGLLLVSRYPIRSAECLGDESTGESGAAMRYELDTPAGTVSLFQLHFASPRKGLWSAAGERPGGTAALEAQSALRRRQSENLARAAGRVPGPVLLAGDFNTPPQSAIFRQVWADYTDAFAAAGWGWGYTFISRRALGRIDHILMGPGWRCDRCWVGPDVGSPHRPVIAELTWSSPGPA